MADSLVHKFLLVISMVLLLLATNNVEAILQPTNYQHTLSLSVAISKVATFLFEYLGMAKSLQWFSSTLRLMEFYLQVALRVSLQ
jgi:hypothetical protein